MKKLLAVAALSFAALGAHAGTTMFGRYDCGTWIKSPSDVQRVWLNGFLSGINSMSNVDALDQVSSADQFFVWMDNYCKAHPLDKVSTGAIELFLELSERARTRQ
jgi:hypothetical protein